MSRTPSTYFAPPERSSREELEEQIRVLREAPIVRNVMDRIPTVVLILNHHRQALYVNRSLLRLLHAEDEGDILSKRPGEILECVNADTLPAGCGTAEFCRTCGAAQAILESQKGKSASYECRITRMVDGQTESLDLQVQATPWEYDGENLTIFAVEDISGKKRREALERIFFHDISNTSGAVIGFAQMARMVPAERQPEVLEKLLGAADQLTAEITAQRQLLDAENGRVELNLTPLASSELLGDARSTYQGHPVARDIAIEIDPSCTSFRIVSDPALLCRVLGNMLKNALEASSPGDTVNMGSDAQGEFGEFWVHNPTAMPRDVELQIFQRSFSTKGTGRGLGTYSMRLLTERYLDGKVTFTTSPEHGTTFRARFPLVHPEYQET